MLIMAMIPIRENIPNIIIPITHLSLLLLSSIKFTRLPSELSIWLTASRGSLWRKTC